MYNAYISSTLSLRCKGSSFSYTDYSHLLNDRFDRHPLLFSPSSSTPCCAACANSVYKLPINPDTILYGLRQSTLIQLSPCRSLIWGGLDRCYSRIPVCEIDRKCCCCERSCYVKQTNDNGRKGRWGKGRPRCTDSEERSERHLMCDDVDAEVMLSLLTEVVSDEGFCVRDRNDRASRRVPVEERGNAATIYNMGKKKKVNAGVLESKSKSDNESFRFKYAEEEDKRWKKERWEEERGRFSRDENHRARARDGGSSCSSYHSLSSSGEFESDTDSRVTNEGLVESSINHNQDSNRNAEIRYGRNIEGEMKRQGDYADEIAAISKKDTTAVGSYTTSTDVKSDWRQNSEKQLTDISVEQTELRKESFQKHSRLQDAHESDFRNTFSLSRKYDDRKGKSTLSVDIDKEIKQQYRQTGDQVTGQSESKAKYKQFSEMAEIHGSGVKTMASSHKQQNSRKENLASEVNSVKEARKEHLTTSSHINREDEFTKKSLEIVDLSEIQEVNISKTSTSQQHSESLRKSSHRDSTESMSSVYRKGELHHQAGQQFTEKMDSRGKSQQLAHKSDVHNSVRESTFVSPRPCNTESKKNGVDSNLVFSSHSETRGEFKAVADGQKVLEKRASNQESCSTTELKLVEETRERHDITTNKLMQIGWSIESQGLTEELSFRGDIPAKTSTHESLELNSQSILQKNVPDLGLNRGSQETLLLPSSQLAAREQGASGSLEVGRTHGEHYDIIAHQDVLDSADRLQKSSMHYVDEFIETARNNVSTSEIQEGKRTHEIKLACEDKQHKQSGSSHSSSGDSQLKGHDSRRVSRSSGTKSSGTKGPSDELWDMTDPPHPESSETEAVKGSTATENVVLKRSGRSLWNIIVDVVQLRWFSHSKSHITTSTSGRKSSPCQSSSSDAFYSGHEHDEVSDDTVRQGKRTMPHDPVSDDKQQLGRAPLSIDEEPCSGTSKDKEKHGGVKSPSSSNILEIGSASKGISTFSSEGEYEKNIEATFSGSAVVESSVPLPTICLRRSPIVEEISESDKTESSGSGSGTKNKDTQLRRGKFQRANQVLTDRFHEWEEAYKIESEQRKIDEMFMREALLEAKKAAARWEVPVGAVLVRGGNIIARGCNLVEELRDSTAHAEMICIREASNILRTWRLSECTLYVTLEPCPMCAGAILQARVDTVVWGAPNKLLGADGSWIRLFPDASRGGNELEATDKPAAPVHPFHPKMTVRRRVLETECADAMQQFFQLRRRKEKTPEPPTPPSCLPVSNRPSKFLFKMHHALNLLFCL